jgi:hypothetical protein
MSFNTNRMESKAVVEKSIPRETLGKFVITGVTTMKDKSIRDGLVLNLILLAYQEDPKKDWVKTVVVKKINGDTVAELPEGSKGLEANKIRGSRFDFKYKEGEEWKVIYTSQVSKDAFIEELKVDNPDFDSLSPDQIDDEYDDWLQECFLWMLQKELKINTPIVPGLQVQLYRTYVPPKTDQKWGNVNVSKFPIKDSTKFADPAPDETKQLPTEVLEAITNVMAIEKARRSKAKGAKDDDLPF